MLRAPSFDSGFRSRLENKVFYPAWVGELKKMASVNDTTLICVRAKYIFGLALRCSTVIKRAAHSKKRMSNTRTYFCPFYLFKA